tara:strand:+ start:2000 stop:2182 length:183 start_codon:yes stop_codon:yes gene_type:complete
MLWVLPNDNDAPVINPIKPKDKFAKIKLKPLNPKTIFYTKQKPKKGPCGKTKKQGCKCKM